MGFHNMYAGLHDKAKMPATGSILRLSGGAKMVAWGTAVPGAVAGYATGCLFIHTDGAAATAVYVNEGTATSASFVAAITSASITLDSAFDAGKIINGADSLANAVQIGDGTDAILLYRLGANACRIDTGSGSALTLAPAGNLTLAPAGGTTAITGAATISTTLNVTGALTAGSLALGSLAIDAVVAATADTALSLDGQGTGGVALGTTSTGNVALMRNTTLAASRTLTLAGVAGSNIFVMTAGDAVLSDGSLTITDNDNAAALVITNDTITSGSLATLASTSLTTGKGISVTADAVTSGSLVYLETSAATFTGKYIQCYDGAADDFSVGLYGATIIAGNAAGTDALTITAGDLGIAAGYVDLDNGIVTVDSTGDIANYFKRNYNGVGTAPVMTIESTHASGTQAALAVVQSGTGASDAMTIAHAGTGDGLKITTSDVAGTCLDLQCAASTTDSMLKVDGSTGNWLGATNVGMVNLVCDGALAHANASLLYIAYSGAGAATGLGTSLRIIDTGSTATSYAAYISAATGEALYVAVGIAKFAETVNLDTGITFTTSGAIISEDATNTNWNAGAANEALNFGPTTAMDVVMHGAGAGKDLFFDASGSQLYVGATVGAGQRAGTVGDSCINIFNGVAAPAGALANATTLYTEGGELKVLDATGNSTTLSPHETVDGKIGADWTFHSVNTVSGKMLHIEVEKLLKALAAQDPALAQYIVEK